MRQASPSRLLSGVDFRVYSHHGQGLGKGLLIDALKRIEEAADIVGVRAVIVHAIDESARKFYEHFGFDPSPIDPFHQMLLLKDLRRALR
jgi:GNAT superfamily N-acetyltransferase